MTGFDYSGARLGESSFSTPDTYGPFGASTYAVPLTLNAEGIRSLSITGDNTGLGLVFDDLSITPAVPEPEIYALMLAGMAVVGAAAKRKARRAK